VAPKKEITEDASSMAKKIREISISEFFAKNRHLLGFDNPVKSLLTTVREAVDNALDACEEARILPSIQISIGELSESRYLVSIEDNGPGILKSHLPNIFGKLLYGSKFHRLKQSRGQQGIGISAAVMYGQMTTGKPADIISKTGKNKPVHRISLAIDTKNNAPKVLKDDVLVHPHWQAKTSGTKITLELEGAYKEGKHGVLAYLRQSALSNPHADMTFTDPKGRVHEFPRLVNKPPIEPKEIKPHPLGIELGTLIQFLHDAKNQSVADFLKNEFSRVTDEVAHEICLNAKIKPTMKAAKVDRSDAEAIFRSMQEAKLMAPPTNCLSPLNEDSIIKALYWFFVEASRIKSSGEAQETVDELPKTEQKTKEPEKPTKSKKKIAQEEFEFLNSEVRAESEEVAKTKIDNTIQHLTDTQEKAVLSEEEGFFVTAVTRPPSVYRGNPFQIEVGIFYGRSLASDALVEVCRYANRVPLQYQASACAMTKAVMAAPWKLYGLQQSRGALPLGPVVIMVSISSVWVPYTSESKEAVAHYPEIVKELRLALMEGGRRLQRFLNKRKRQTDEAKKRSYIEKYLDPIQEALSEILGEKKAEPKKLAEDLRYILEKSRAHKTVKMAKHEVK
jgi:DNA topoisomerase-6 subunit B